MEGGGVSQEIREKKPRNLKWYLGVVVGVLVLAWFVVLGDYIAYVYQLTH